jgi:glycosyltransferase involved in cell wall biosynthesis
MPENYENLENLDYPLDLVCFSHLRWDFVYQRPQHLMSRCARERRVFFFEEPLYEKELKRAALEVRITSCGVHVVAPRLPASTEPEQGCDRLRKLVDNLFKKYFIQDSILWYYTPMALPFTRHLKPAMAVYDCMDELSGFRGAPAHIRDLENELFALCDIVFTGGVALYEAKAHKHKNIHVFPSSIDALHFAQARDIKQIPKDEAFIPRPRLGFSGVIDERMNLNLVSELAQKRPDWHIVLIGPVAKLIPEELPRNHNIHYLGLKPYEALPSYMAGWDVGIMPFAHNSATRFISPTKTPEYLSAGLPVISTSIRDVVRTYGILGFVDIADTSEEFISKTEYILAHPEEAATRLSRFDDYIADNSWENTWNSMFNLIIHALAKNSTTSQAGRSVEFPQWQSPLTGEKDV